MREKQKTVAMMIMTTILLELASSLSRRNLSLVRSCSRASTTGTTPYKSTGSYYNTNFNNTNNNTRLIMIGSKELLLRHLMALTILTCPNHAFLLQPSSIILSKTTTIIRKTGTRSSGNKNDIIIVFKKDYCYS